MTGDEWLFGIFPKEIETLLKEGLKDSFKYPLKSNSLDNGNGLQEIRIRAGKPIILNETKGEKIINYKVTKEDIQYILQKISNYSLYAYEEEIKQGFITVKGGHRIGIAGECVMEKGRVKTIRNIGSLNIRISRQVENCSRKILKYILSRERVYNTLIISPPKCGKTTILRDIAKNISNGIESRDIKGRKVAIIDERSEIGASYRGVPQMNVGIRTDILDNCAKSQGMIMAIRSLAPEVIICDEIGTKEDVEALVMAFNSGVNIICTIHGFGIEDVYRRPVFADLIRNKILDRVIVLSSKNGPGTVEGIYKIEEEGEKRWSRL